jgi:hypothetical protein
VTLWAILWRFASWVFGDLSKGSGEQERPRAWGLAAKVVYHSGVEWAIKSFEPYKAPGTDRIYPILLQEGLGILLGPLTKAFWASIALRYVPQGWGLLR